jgi:hypothetical protein
LTAEAELPPIDHALDPKIAPIVKLLRVVSLRERLERLCDCQHEFLCHAETFDDGAEGCNILGCNCRRFTTKPVRRRR